MTARKFDFRIYEIQLRTCINTEERGGKHKMTNLLGVLQTLFGQIAGLRQLIIHERTWTTDLSLSLLCANRSWAIVCMPSKSGARSPISVTQLELKKSPVRVLMKYLPRALWLGNGGITCHGKEALHVESMSLTNTENKCSDQRPLTCSIRLTRFCSWLLPSLAFPQGLPSHCPRWSGLFWSSQSHTFSVCSPRNSPSDHELFEGRSNPGLTLDARSSNKCLVRNNKCMKGLLYIYIILYL